MARVNRTCAEAGRGGAGSGTRLSVCRRSNPTACAFSVRRSGPSSNRPLGRFRLDLPLLLTPLGLSERLPDSCPPMSSDQRNARIFGVLFLITFVTSIPALALYQPVLDDPAGHIAGGGEDNQIYLGALLELLLIIANVGTAVVVFPILRRQNEVLSLGYVTARLVECTFIAAGIIFVLGIVSLRQDSPDAADLAVSLAALKDWTFLLGPASSSAGEMG
jgi:hypothetical protein